MRYITVVAGKAVLIDLGNTLMTPVPVDGDAVARLEAERLRTVLRGFGFADLSGLEEALRRYAEVDRLAHARSLKTLRERLGKDILRRVLRDAGFALTPAQALAAARAQWLGFPAYGWRAYPDATETLRALKERGFSVAIVSNGSHGVDFWRQDLEEFGWLAYLDAIFSSGDLIWRKPHPLLFERALEALGVSPDEALMVGDMVEMDVAGAKALGITAVWKRNGQPLPPSADADYTIDHLGELLALPALS